MVEVEDFPMNGQNFIDARKAATFYKHSRV